MYRNNINCIINVVEMEMKNKWMNEWTKLCLIKLLYDVPHFVVITTGIAKRAVDQSSINLLNHLSLPSNSKKQKLLYFMILISLFNPQKIFSLIIFLMFFFSVSSINYRIKFTSFDFFIYFRCDYFFFRQGRQSSWVSS